MHYSVRKVSGHILFFENLVDFNDVRLHKATLNPHTHARIFPCLTIASVDDNQNLSEVEFNGLVGFS